MRVVYEKILVAVDQSPISDRAVLAARDLAQLSKGEVWLLHLREFEWGGRAGALPPRETPSEAEAEVKASVEILTQAGVKAHGVVKNTGYGYAAREIVADAIELDCGIIVMGSRGRSDLAGLVLGSTAHKVIHLTDRPVLIVR
ncbi:universal stress protein [Trebonia kvetii]|nr:universal stress protein [Trebonia kvetii]